MAFWPILMVMPFCKKGMKLLVGFPDSHARLDPSFRNGKEVFDRNLLDLRISEEEIVVKSDSIAGKRLSDLNLSEYGCFLNRVVRAQIEMPMDLDIVLAKGDVLQVSGEKSKVKGWQIKSVLSLYTAKWLICLLSVAFYSWHSVWFGHHDLWPSVV